MTGQAPRIIRCGTVEYSRAPICPPMTMLFRIIPRSSNLVQDKTVTHDVRNGADVLVFNEWKWHGPPARESWNHGQDAHATSSSLNRDSAPLSVNLVSSHSNSRQRQRGGDLCTAQPPNDVRIRILQGVGP